jgi:hypothetical protein
MRATLQVISPSPAIRKLHQLQKKKSCQKGSLNKQDPFVETTCRVPLPCIQKEKIEKIEKNGIKNTSNTGFNALSAMGMYDASDHLGWPLAIRGIHGIVDFWGGRHTGGAGVSSAALNHRHWLAWLSSIHQE